MSAAHPNPTISGRKGLGATEWTLIKIATAILVALLVYALWVSEKNLPWDQVLKWFK